MKVRVKVVATKSMFIDERRWDNINLDEGTNNPFDEFHIAQYVKGCLVEDLRNDPNRGTCSIEKLDD